MERRIEIVRQTLKDQKLDAFFVTNPVNITYFTGFSTLAPDEREAFLFLTQKNIYFLTYPTYFHEFKNKDENIKVLNITRDQTLFVNLSKIVEEEKITSCAIEAENLTVFELNLLKERIPINFSETNKLGEIQRAVKDETEINSIRQAAKITDEAFSYILTKLKKDVSEKEIALEIEFFLKKNSGDIAFPPIVAFGTNTSNPHHFSDNSKQLTDNSLILLDFGARFNEYCSDMTRVVFFGTPSDEQVKIYNTVFTAQQKALDMIKPGLRGQEADAVAREYIISQNYPAFPHGLGHGVGLSIHEDPRLRRDIVKILEKNMIVTVEPGIYLEGNCGVRIEDLVLLREDGIEILSKSKKEIIIL